MSVMDSEEKEFWIFSGILLAVFGNGIYFLFQGSLGGGIPCTLIGLVGLLAMLRERFGVWRMRVRDAVSSTKVHVAFPFKVLSIIGVAVVSIQISSVVFSVRRDLDNYVMPRVVTTDEAKKLRDYLSHYDKYKVRVKMIPYDYEAQQYALEIYNAMLDTNWDVEGSGPETILFSATPRPKKSDYKNDADYLEARDDWIESFVNGRFDEEVTGQQGLCIRVESSGAPITKNPKHPTSDIVLRDALKYAGISSGCLNGGATAEHYTVSLIVGHRPRELNPHETRKRK